MKNVAKLLREADREALAHFHSQPSYKAFKRLVELERLELAKDNLSQGHVIDSNYVAYLNGGADKLKGLVKLIEEIADYEDKKS